MSHCPLLDPVSKLPRVGPVRAQKLSDLGLRQVGDLLRQFPRTFENRRRTLVADALPHQISVVELTVVRAMFLGFGRHRRLEVATQDAQGTLLKLLFFNAGRINVKAHFLPSTQIVATGKIDSVKGHAQCIHPRVQRAENSAAQEDGLFPVYPQIKELSGQALAGYVHTALAYIGQKQIDDPFAQDFLHTHQIAPIPDAFHWVHTPVEEQKRQSSLRRFAFEEVFSLQLAMQKRKQKERVKQAIVVPPQDARALFAKLLPFAPTGAQVRALDEIAFDLTSGQPMSRLLQGDVGAGKTAVCAAACLMMLAAKAQCAVLAPTDILAEQHLANFQKWFAPLGVRVAKLSASQKAAEKRAILQSLQAGEIDIVVGTHALLSEGVHFARLGLCIVDEQHRFGVAQRRLLREKGETTGQSPHLLVMTATPIPRSLALTLYGDMALSIIDELPPGRKPVQTKIVMGNGQHIAQRFAAKMVRDNEQAFIIYPLVAESEKLDLQNAVHAFEQLRAEFGSDAIALVHGQMKHDEKEHAMQRFVRGEANILISTTVVEVGVDVPAASTMLIMNAERFGLSQLHQLRGRVGRGTQQSFCYLAVEKETSADAKRRLLVMERTNDGFEIANEDLAIRGPGDLLGTRQAGLATLEFFDFAQHGDLVELARQKALEAIQRDPMLEASWVKPFLDRADEFLAC